MAHFAEIDHTGAVIRVVVVDNRDCMTNQGVEYEEVGVSHLERMFGGDWVQCSYSGALRKNFPGPGYFYDKDADAFIAPKPFASWVLNSNFRWEAPVSPPDDAGRYTWDEGSLAWVNVL